MIREILFRGQNSDNKEWYYGFLFDDGLIESSRKFIGGIVIEDYKGSADDRFEITGIDFCEVIPETIGQYTGLHDNTKWEELSKDEKEKFLSKWNYKEQRQNIKEDWNGRKIFEGDIVKTFLCIDDHNEPLYEYGKIIYDENNGAFLISCDEYLLEIRIWGNIEVIGNIFDNPELLKGETDGKDEN